MNANLYLKEKLLCKTDDYLFCYYKGHLVLRKCSGKSFVKKLRIQSVIKSNRFVERVFRYEPRTAVPVGKNNFIFSIHGKIYNYSVESNSVILEHEFIKGMNNPLTFCARYDEFGNIADLLYGEYINTSDKKPVSVYRRGNDEWKKVYSFPAGAVKHIHNIFYDKFKNRYIILTGDSDEESGIWDANMDFTNVRPIVAGKQIYRACVCFPTKDGIYYPTDTPLERNRLYKLNEKSDGTVSLIELYEMPGPCIYGIEHVESLYMATSVEGDPSQSAFKYRLSNKLGKGVKDRYVHIIKFSLDETVSEIASLKKDMLPMWLFQFGNAKFPSQSDGDSIYICPQSCKNSDGTYEIRM